MLSNKSKRIINIIVWIVVAITVLLMIINAIIQISENRRIAKWEFEQQKILENALQSLNTSKCSSYKYPLGCGVMIARKTSLEACENLGDKESYLVLACKSATSKNLSFCNPLNKYDKWTCEELAQSAIDKIKDES